MVENISELTDLIFSLQDQNGCWNVLKPGDKYYPDYQHYCPNYKSTLWTLIFLADICYSPIDDEIEKPLNVISEHFFDKDSGIYILGQDHFPIPCLNGNMIYLNSFFNAGDEKSINSVIDFFAEYQRFDDGDYNTPAEYPYFRNRSCYGAHSCYWGIVKLLKGLSFIPAHKRSQNAQELINRCIEFILLHNVCFSSHNKDALIQQYIGRIGLPNMYRSDFLEILWLLKRENVKDKRVCSAVKLLRSRMLPDGTWKIERKTAKLVVSFPAQKYANSFVTERAKDVMNYYSSFL